MEGLITAIVVREWDGWLSYMRLLLFEDVGGGC